MNNKQECLIKAAVAGVVTGGLAFVAVNSFGRKKSFRRMSAAKAFKMIGSVMDAL